MLSGYLHDRPEYRFAPDSLNKTKKQERNKHLIISGDENINWTKKLAKTEHLPCAECFHFYSTNINNIPCELEILEIRWNNKIKEWIYEMNIYYDDKKKKWICNKKNVKE